MVSMGRLACALFFVCCFTLAAFSDPDCVIDLECEECVPDNLPLVTPQRAANGSVRARHGDEVVLACAGGKFMLYPLRDTLAAVCEAGLYRVRHDGVLRHLLELGCQENIFEDVLHQVEYCDAPLQGRAYTLQGGASRTRHLAALCFDEDRALLVRAHTSNAPRNELALPAHADTRAPLSLLGNFNHMFDARTRSAALQLYSDDARMTRRARELFKHDRVCFADQSLTAAKLLPGHYFDDQNMRVTDFVSNKVAVWRSVSAGNLHHLHHDVARLLRHARPRTTLDVYTGTHAVQTLRTPTAKKDLYLKPGRFPVPKYIWTVVHDKQHEKALAVILLNDPFVAVSEIREAVFCESMCSDVSWLRELRRNRNYETPLYGLVFCCDVHNFTNIVTEMPRNILAGVRPDDFGMLTDLPA